MSKTVDNVLQMARLKLFGDTTSEKLTDANGIFLTNMALEDFILLIMQYQGDWEINGNEALKDIAVGANQIDLGSTMIKLNRVEIKYPSTAESYQTAKQIDHKSISCAMEEYSTSIPEFDLYDGDKMYIFVSHKKAEIAAVTSGVRIFFQIDFTEITATTDENDSTYPGTIKLIGKLVAYEYATSKSMTTKASQLEKEIQRDMLSMANYFANKSTAKRIRLVPRREDFNQNIIGGNVGLPTIDL